MLLVHDLMLLLLDDDSGKQKVTTDIPALLAGALLVELANAGAVDVAEGSLLRKARLVLPPDAPTPADPRLADPLLAQAADTVAGLVGKTPDRALLRLGKGLRERALADLVGAGILTEQKHKTLGTLGLFRSTRYPAVSSTYEDELRSRLTAVLGGRLRPDAQTGPLLALLDASRALPRIVEVADRHAATAVLKEVSEGAWAAASVRRAVQTTQSIASAAATTAAMTAATNAAITN